jgi:ketosteroid isomerase-like protein
MKALLSPMLLIIFAQYGGAQTIESATETAVRAADKAWAEAAASKDVDRMLSFYDKDATFIGETGNLITGKDDLRKL